jgi:hypothetical protein
LREQCIGIERYRRDKLVELAGIEQWGCRRLLAAELFGLRPSGPTGKQRQDQG